MFHFLNRINYTLHKPLKNNIMLSTMDAIETKKNLTDYMSTLKVGDKFSVNVRTLTANKLYMSTYLPTYMLENGYMDASRTILKLVTDNQAFLDDIKIEYKKRYTEQKKAKYEILGGVGKDELGLYADKRISESKPVIIKEEKPLYDDFNDPFDTEKMGTTEPFLKQKEQVYSDLNLVEMLRARGYTVTCIKVVEQTIEL